MDVDRTIIIDETIREGMQFRGLVFSIEQRMRMLDFQESAGVDICQAGYPPAHESEALAVSSLHRHALDKGYSISVAGMGRLHPGDIEILIKTGIQDFHLHAHIQNTEDAHARDAFFEEAKKAIQKIRNRVPRAKIFIALLDIGKTPISLLRQSVDVLACKLGIDLLSLPDTSGILTPKQTYRIISQLAEKAKKSTTRLSIHCHNDMGMASANTIAGIDAGGRAIEVAALGIGERNGIADLYATARLLENQGDNIKLALDDVNLFEEYYAHVDDIIAAQTGEHIINYMTPFFGQGVRTHVAGTHANGSFGMPLQPEYFLNPLCGNRLVKSYLSLHGIPFESTALPRITQEIKSRSALLNRCLTKQEIIDITGLNL